MTVFMDSSKCEIEEEREAKTKEETRNLQPQESEIEGKKERQIGEDSEGEKVKGVEDKLLKKEAPGASKGVQEHCRSWLEKIFKWEGSGTGNQPNIDKDGTGKNELQQPAKKEAENLNAAKILRLIARNDWAPVLEACRNSTDIFQIQIPESADFVVHMAAKHGGSIIFTQVIEAAGEAARKGGKETKEGEFKDGVLDLINGDGNTVLHLAAMKNDLEICKFLLGSDVGEKHSEVWFTKNIKGESPLYMCAKYNSVNCFKFLLQSFLDSKQLANVSTLYDMFTCGAEEDTVLHLTIRAGSLDLASTVMGHVPGLVLSKNKNRETPVEILASLPTVFKSCSENGCLTNCCVYPCIPQRVVQNAEASWYLSPATIIQRKRNHMRATNLLSQMLDHLIENDLENGQNPWEENGPIAKAINGGAVEVVKSIFEAFPNVIAGRKTRGQDHLIFLAVSCRNSAIFKLILGKSQDVVRTWKINIKTNLLHCAASYRDYDAWSNLGSAGHMRLEDKWYKKVKSALPEELQHGEDKYGLTPDQVFDRSHADLLKSSQEWIKSFTGVCLIVTALFVIFALTTFSIVPGGKDDEGLPRHRHMLAYQVYRYCCSAASAFGVLALFTFVGLRSDNLMNKKSFSAKLWGILIGMNACYFCCACLFVGVFFGTVVVEGQKKKDIIIACTSFALSGVIYLFIWQWMSYKNLWKALFWPI